MIAFWMNHTRLASRQCICWYMNPCRFIIISRRVRVCDSLLLVLSIHISTSITRAPFDDNATQSLCTVTHVARGQSLPSNIARNLISSWRNWAQCKLTSLASLLFSSLPTSHHLCLYIYISFSLVAVIETEHRPSGNYVIKSFWRTDSAQIALSLWCISLAMKYDRCSIWAISILSVSEWVHCRALRAKSFLCQAGAWEKEISRLAHWLLV
jgi:hypothetical protein